MKPIKRKAARVLHNATLTTLEAVDYKVFKALRERPDDIIGLVAHRLEFGLGPARDIQASLDKLLAFHLIKRVSEPDVERPLYSATLPGEYRRLLSDDFTRALEFLNPVSLE